MGKNCWLFACNPMQRIDAFVETWPVYNVAPSNLWTHPRCGDLINAFWFSDRAEIPPSLDLFLRITNSTCKYVCMDVIHKHICMLYTHTDFLSLLKATEIQLTSAYWPGINDLAKLTCQLWTLSYGSLDFPKHPVISPAATEGFIS